MHSSRNISQILSPALAAIALSAFIAGCTPTSNDDGMSSSSSSRSEAMMEVSSTTSASSSAASSDDAIQSTSETPIRRASSSIPMVNAVPTSSQPTVDDTSAYNDGVYTVNGVYRSPAGTEEIQVSLTLQHDVVTSAHATVMASNPKSKMMQEAFIAGFGAQVIGKPIDGLALGVVNGSSLTPMGFMDAVAKIKAEAKGA